MSSEDAGLKACLSRNGRFRARVAQSKTDGKEFQMKVATVKRKITLSILTMMALICGLSGMSYGQKAMTVLNAECKATAIIPSSDLVDVTVKGTLRANRAVEDVRGWLTLNGTKIGQGGTPAIFNPGVGYIGGKAFGDFSAGETKSFSITETSRLVRDGDRCGVSFEWREVNPPSRPSPDPEPASPNPKPDPEYNVGDTIPGFPFPSGTFTFGNRLTFNNTVYTCVFLTN